MDNAFHKMLREVIEVPESMPLAVKAMLEASIADAWTDYEGDPGNPEAFWNFLTGKDAS